MEGDGAEKLWQTAGKNFNPLPPHGGRHYTTFQKKMQVNISIHSLRMEGDAPGIIFLFFNVISIHSLRMEGDDGITWQCQTHWHFNPLPPHGGRLEVQLIQDARQRISIHSLRMEGD